MKYHMAAFFFGFLLDLCLGDPHWLPHPIRLIGKLILRLERMLRGEVGEEDGQKDDGKRSRQGYEHRREQNKGIVLVVAVTASAVLVAALFLAGAYGIHPYIGVVTEIIMTYQILAAKCLKTESMKVYKSLKEGNLNGARKAVSMLVGRDTDALDEEGVAKAAIETVAENTSDGVIAPMLYTALGGPVLGFFYKAVNTMDSMVGYKNDKYLYFGKAAARLDDAVNFLPSRISANLMILAAFLGGKSFHGKQAFKIHQRDSRKHASPNAAQTESVCAGALGLQLAGPARYFGRIVEKPYIGDVLRRVEYEDIKRANRLMYVTAWLCELLCLALMAAVIWILEGK